MSDRRTAQMCDLMLGERVKKILLRVRSGGTLPLATTEIDHRGTSRCSGTSARSRDRPDACPCGRSRRCRPRAMTRPVLIHHALGVAGHCQGVVERDRIPFIARHGPGRKSGSPSAKSASYSTSPSRSPRTEYTGSSPVDDNRLDLCLRQRRLDYSRKLAVGDERLGFAVIKRKATIAGSSRVLSALSTAPVIGAVGAPWWHSSIGGVLASITATVSPRPMPRRAKRGREDAASGRRSRGKNQRRTCDDDGCAVREHACGPLQKGERGQ